MFSQEFDPKASDVTLTGMKIALVVDNQDPKGAERLLLRVLGVHSMTNVTSDNGVWSHRIPSDSGSSGSVPDVGEYVYCMFPDPEDPMVIIWFGVIRSMNDLAGSSVVRGSLKTQPGEAFVSTYAQMNVPNGSGGYVAKAAPANTPDSRITKNTAGGKIPEKALTTERGQYSKVHVIKETKAGHVIFFDETPGNERIFILHPNGTYINIDKNDMTEKITGDRISLHNKNWNIEIKGDHLEFVHGDMKFEVDGNHDEIIKGSLIVTVTGNVKLEAGGNIDVTAAGTANVTAAVINLNT